MKKQSKWKINLTLTELNHLKQDVGVKTLKAFKARRLFQREMESEFFVCKECVKIAKKIGFE